MLVSMPPRSSVTPTEPGELTAPLPSISVSTPSAEARAGLEVSSGRTLRRHRGQGLVLTSPRACREEDRALMEGVALWPTAAGLMVLSFIGAVVSAIAGFGGGMLFLPFLAQVVGPERAVPILTVMLLLATPSRAFLNRREVRWRIVGWYALGSSLGAVLGAFVFLSLPVFWLLKAIGAFLILAVVSRHVPGGKLRIVDERAFAPIGAGGGFIGGVVGGMGPMVSPFFLAAGLTGPGFVGTVAACAVWMHVVKLFVYDRGGAVGTGTLTLGLALGLAMVFGTFAGTKVLGRLDAARFTLIVESLLVLIGIWFLVASR